MVKATDDVLRRSIRYHDCEIFAEARLEDRGGEMTFFAQWEILKNGEDRHFSHSEKTYETAELALQAAEDGGRRDVDQNMGDNDSPTRSQ
jgi:hypothetical protein